MAVSRLDQTRRNGSSARVVYEQGKAQRPTRRPSSVRKGTAAGAEYDRLWRMPVAQLWRAEDADQVARLAVMRVQLRHPDNAGGSMEAKARALEREFFVGPDARRQAGIEIRDGLPPAPTAQVRALDSDRSAAMVAAVQ